MIKTRLVRLLSHAKKYIVGQVLCQWLGLWCRVVTVLAASSLLEAAWLGKLDTDILRRWGLIVLLALLLKVALDRMSSRLSYLASADVKRVLRERIYDKLLRLGASYRERVSSAELTQLSVEGVEQLETYFGRYLPQFFYSLLAPLTLFCLLAFVSFKASLVLLICVPLIPVSIVVVQKIAKRLVKKYLDIYASHGVGLALVGRSSRTLGTLLITLAVARGLLHYGEQYCNHFIAFKLLAIIRHKIFAALRRLCPAKLEGRDRGNLIAILTADIELLEVFYAHTVSPIAIAVLIGLIMLSFLGKLYTRAVWIALGGYLAVGLLVPLWNGRRSAGAGMRFREGFGELNSFVLESLRGLDETIQYGHGQARREEISMRSRAMAALQRELNRYEQGQRALTNLLIELFSFGMLFFLLGTYQRGAVDFAALLLGTVTMMGSFGPMVALSSLSNTLSQTLASGERVLRLLEEKPQVEELADGQTVAFNGAELQDVSFSYGGEEILHDFSLTIPKGQILGVHGPSGSGKSTLLKLLMRFWDVQSGQVRISDTDVRRLNTANLRALEAYMTQETTLFHDSIRANIVVGKLNASDEEVEAAAKKAAIHDFIAGLPRGYDTAVSELGDSLSGGEKQRIGLARAFLHDALLLLLDEPTSNLDSLNEGAILKSLHESARDKTVLLVSHRDSTMNIADTILEMDRGRRS